MCYDDKAKPPLPPGEIGKASGSDLILTADDGNQFLAYLAMPEQPARARMLIYPDVRGLHQFYKDLALRFAEVGIASIAIDYFGRTEGMGSRTEGFDFWPHVNQMTLPSLLSDARAGIAQLAKSSPSTSQFCVGFCLGGSLAFLSGAEDLGLNAVIGFYSGFSRNMDGRGTLLERANQIRVPALGIFGGADQHIPTEQVNAFDQALDASGVAHKIMSYAGAPHSFFDRSAEQYAEASADAWRQVLSFVREHSRN